MFSLLFSEYLSSPLTAHQETVYAHLFLITICCSPLQPNLLLDKIMTSQMFLTQLMAVPQCTGILLKQLL